MKSLVTWGALVGIVPLLGTMSYCLLQQAKERRPPESLRKLSNNGKTVQWTLGDADGDGQSDSMELSHGTDPWNPASHCFNLSLVETGIFSTTNQLTAEIRFGTNVVVGPVIMTNRTWEVNVGHLTTTNRERVAVCFWDDANTNGVCEVWETAISGSTLSWTDNNGNFGCPTLQRDVAGSSIQATAQYSGYPLSNSGFERKTVRSKVLGLTIANAFEVFFPSDGTHHPACSTCPGCPNWFYYWREGGVCGIAGDIVFNGSLPSDGETIVYAQFDHRTRQVSLGSKAPQIRSKNYGTTYRYETIILPPIIQKTIIGGVEESIILSPAITNVYRHEVRQFEIGAVGAGIRAVALSIKHENRHKAIFINQLYSGVTGPVPDIDGFLDAVFATGIQDNNPFGVNPEEVEEGVLDRDGEGVLDAAEVSGQWGYKTETNRRDTFNLAQGIHPDYMLYGDEEAQARHAENEELESAYRLELDWCNPGCNSKYRRGPMVDESPITR